MQAKKRSAHIFGALLVLVPAAGIWLFILYSRGGPESADAAAKPEAGWMRIVQNVPNWSIIGALQFVPAKEAELKPGEVRLRIANDELDRSLTERPGGAPGDLPAFRVHEWKEGCLAKLPVPATPFGLDLSGSNVTDAGLKELAGLKSLQALNLNDTQASDDGLKELAGLKSLQWLNLRNTKVTDTGLKALAGLKTLQWLDLYNTPVTDAGLKELAGLTSLRCSYSRRV